MAAGDERKCRGCDTIFLVGPNERRRREWCNQACANRVRWAKISPGPRPKADPYAPYCGVKYGNCTICGQLWCRPARGRGALSCWRDECIKEAKNRNARDRYATDPTKGVERARLQRATHTDAERARIAELRQAWLAQLPEAMCAVCGKPTGKPLRTRRQACSNACRTALRPPYIPKPKPPKPPPPTWQRTCQRCGVAFETDRPTQVHCTARCGDKARTERRKIAKRQTGSVIGRVYRALVFQRDDYVCWLCDYPTKRDAVVPDPEAPTVDHVIPLAKGGPHTMDNVRTAHFLCNSMKGDSLAG